MTRRQISYRSWYSPRVLSEMLRAFIVLGNSFKGFESHRFGIANFSCSHADNEATMLRVRADGRLQPSTIDGVRDLWAAQQWRGNDCNLQSHAYICVWPMFFKHVCSCRGTGSSLFASSSESWRSSSRLIRVDNDAGRIFWKSCNWFLLKASFLESTPGRIASCCATRENWK